MMRVITANTDQFANLANLRLELKAAEQRSELDSEEAQLKQAREVLINTMQTYHRSRFELGRALWGYRAPYKANRGWMPAAKTIAAFLKLSLRTLFRIIDDYESASNLPRLTLEALQQLDVDPAAAKHRELVGDLLGMSEPKTRDEAIAATARAVEKHNTAKQEGKTSLAKGQGKETAEAFANRLVAQCLRRYSALDLKVRDADARCVVDHVVSKLGEKIPSLRDSESIRRRAA
jgi:hypothetical protein